MSKKVPNKRVVALIAECNKAAADLRNASNFAASEGRFVAREVNDARSRKFADTASALVELLAFRNERATTTK